MFVSKHLFTLLLFAASTHAQTTTTFSTDVRVISLFATIRDAQGHVVPNLNKEDFTLEEDGHPQTIRYFSRESGLPLSLGLLIDTSVSQRRLLAEERSASTRFLSQVLRPDMDRAFVIHFDRAVELLQDLTSERNKLGDALARLVTPKHDRSEGGTDLYDSVLLASDELMTKQTGRKAIVLLTDGVDNGSKVDLFRAIEAAERADTLVYSILFADRGAYDGIYASMNGKNALQRISRETGGAFFEVSHSDPISAIYLKLEEALRTQYSIGYTSDRTDPKPGYRKIHLVTRRPGLQVETRDGYFASH
jgi:VWFA-related protein